MPRDFRTRSILARAARDSNFVSDAVGTITDTGVFHLPTLALYANKEGEGAPASPPSPPPPPPPPGKPPKEGPPAEEKVTLTKAELTAQVEAALNAERDRAKKEREQEAAEREAEEAKKRGEFEKLYQTEAEGRKKEQQEKEALKLDLRKTQVQTRLRDFISEHHADYAPAAKYIAPLLDIQADTSDADADKQIKAAVDQYVKDNPRSRVIGPAPSLGHKLPAGTNPPPKPQGEPIRPRGPASRF